MSNFVVNPYMFAVEERGLILDELNSNGTNESASYDMYADLGDDTLSGTWIIRFKLHYSAIVTSGHGDTVNIGITSTSSAVSPTGSNTGLGFKWSSDDGGAVSYSGASMFPAPDEFVPETHASAPVTKYFEMVRSGSTGTDSFTVNVYTASDYSGTPATASQSALGMTGLRYIKVANYDGTSTGSTTGYISEMYLWDNTTSAGSLASANVAPTFADATWLEQDASKLGVGVIE